MELDSAWKRCQLSENFPFRNWGAFKDDQHHVRPENWPGNQIQTIVIIKRCLPRQTKSVFPKLNWKGDPRVSTRRILRLGNLRRLRSWIREINWVAISADLHWRVDEQNVHVGPPVLRFLDPPIIDLESGSSGSQNGTPQKRKREPWFVGRYGRLGVPQGQGKFEARAAKSDDAEWWRREGLRWTIRWWVWTVSIDVDGMQKDVQKSCGLGTTLVLETRRFVTHSNRWIAVEKTSGCRIWVYRIIQCNPKLEVHYSSIPLLVAEGILQITNLKFRHHPQGGFEAKKHIGMRM